MYELQGAGRPHCSSSKSSQRLFAAATVTSGRKVRSDVCKSTLSTAARANCAAPTSKVHIICIMRSATTGASRKHEFAHSRRRFRSAAGGASQRPPGGRQEGLVWAAGFKPRYATPRRHATASSHGLCLLPSPHLQTGARRSTLSRSPLPAHRSAPTCKHAQLAQSRVEPLDGRALLWSTAPCRGAATTPLRQP